MNPKTRESNPSIATISKLSRLNKTSVQEAIKRLESQGFLTVTTGANKRTCNTYWFPDETDHYENFTREFLQKDLKPYLKEYYMRLLPICHSTEDGVKKQNCKLVLTNMTDNEIAKAIGLNVRTVKRYNVLLKEEGLLETKVVNGLVTKTFNQQLLNNIVELLQKTEEKANNAEEIAKDAKDQSNNAEILAKEAIKQIESNDILLDFLLKKEGFSSIEEAKKSLIESKYKI